MKLNEKNNAILVDVMMCCYLLLIMSLCHIIVHLTLFYLQLNRLVTEKWVDGWDDPRLLTLAGLRRRGVSSTAINSFIRGIGITRRYKYMNCCCAHGLVYS